MSSIKSCPFCSEEILANAIKCKHCGSDLQDTMSTSLYVNTSIRLALGDKYEILEVIGKGGMSTVYKAKQKNLNRLVAIKVVHPNLVHDTEFLNRFHKEAQMAASLTHPNIVMIFDEGSLNGVHFIAMEYLEGKDLHCILQEKGKLSVDETIKIIKPIAEALDFAHSKGLVHRDVKSANILVTDSGRPVLTDFGIAHAASGTKLTQAGSVIGTPEYMSPEQAEGKDLDGRSDIFSLGVVMYECLTGKVPFKGDNPLTTIYGIIYDSTPSLKSINAKIPGWLDATVMCALAKSPNERFPTGKVLSEHLNEKKTPSGSFKKLQVKSIKSKKEIHEAKTAGKNSNKTLIGLIVLFTVVIITATFLYLKQAPNGGLFKSKGKINEAASLLPDISNLVNDASILFNDKKYDEALRKYSEAQVLQPENTQVKEKINEINSIITKNNEIQKLTISADKFFEKSDMIKARIDYSKILELDNQNEHATKQMELVNQKLKKDEGIQNEQNFRKFSSLGDSLRRKEQYGGAKTAYEKALRIKPNDENIKKNLDDVIFNLNNNEADAEILIKNARIDLNAGRFSAGKVNLDKALDLVPENLKIKKSLDSLKIVINKLIQTEINNNLITVQGGRFEMGYNSADENQKPAHWVTLATFQIDKYEVSVRQYKLFCNATGRAMPSVPAWGWKDDDPIVNVKWDDAKAFASWAEKRLPTEAEWEYAALGGSETKGNKYSGSNNAGSVATYSQKATTKPKSIGSNAPNELGIFDMSGNAWEWCSDYYSADYYKSSSLENPQGPLKGEFRVIRGGGWNSPTKEIMIKTRGYRNGNSFENSGGFRCVKN